MATRNAPKTPNLSSSQIASAAAAEKARKLASRAALKAASAKPEPASTPAPSTPAQPKADHSDQDAANALATAKVDAEALGVPLEQMLAEMGIDANGKPAAPAEKDRYAGPMLALVAARKAYVQAANGILCNGDKLALLCGQFERPVVVAGLLSALQTAKLVTGNPWSHLNPGQQSMNARNKARHALKSGFITHAAIEAALQAAAK